MKKLLSALFFLVLSNLTFAQGIDFVHNMSWEQILAKAKQENKIIFMDAYAVWCGPCKWMEKNVFATQSVGDFYNKNFINVKMDMEKGDGLALTRTYNVQAYPTLLFINGDGELLHQGIGAHPSDQFLELGKQAIDPNKQAATLKKKYIEGERNPEVLRNYILSLAKSQDGQDISQLVNEYLNTQKDWNTKENVEFILEVTNSSDDRTYAYILNNKAIFENYIGDKQKMSQSMGNILYRTALSKLSQTFEFKTLDEAKDYIRKNAYDSADKMTLTFENYYYRMAGDEAKYIETTYDLMSKYPTKDAQQLNEYAWSFYELENNDPSNMKKALNWALASVKQDSKYYNNDTVAALYYKLKNAKKAKKYAKKAIEIAKKSGEDSSSTQELLDAIGNMKK